MEPERKQKNCMSRNSIIIHDGPVISRMWLIIYCDFGRLWYLATYYKLSIGQAEFIYLVVFLLIL